MIDVKREIILSEGLPVTVSNGSADPVETTILIGRASKQFNQTVSIEANRRAQFLPEVLIDSGSMVTNTLANEKYLVVATMPEIIQGEIATTIAHMFTCNATITVSGVEETLNDRGDVKKQTVVKFEDLECHAESSRSALQQKDPGYFLDCEYLVYAPAGVPITTLDTLTLKSLGEPRTLKVINADYMTFPGLVEIQLSSETRK
ncbi:hypothetical protein [Paenibacillus xylanexedens]|uniref:hypothetical protein n=1 Tax=Paenibacillus xylanexedens TaxID=528191 RepID=UPI0011A47543|nr:hypothetical protein [Paenibacillus xylanexedens]